MGKLETRPTLRALPIMSTRLSDYNYELPRELIANRPLPERDQSRVMVLRREQETIEYRKFGELKALLSDGDLLILNDTRVLPARVFSDDGVVEFLLLERLDGGRWRCLVKPGRKMRVGAVTKIRGVISEVEAIGDG